MPYCSFPTLQLTDCSGRNLTGPWYAKQKLNTSFKHHAVMLLEMQMNYVHKKSGKQGKITEELI